MVTRSNRNPIHTGIDNINGIDEMVIDSELLPTRDIELDCNTICVHCHAAGHRVDTPRYSSAQSHVTAQLT